MAPVVMLRLRGVIRLLAGVPLTAALSSISPTISGCSFVQSVTSWLEHEGMICANADPKLFPQTNHPVLQVSTVDKDESSTQRALLLHLLASPNSLEECVSSTCTREMLQQSTDSPLIHLHQDVWNAKQDIVQSRLLMRFGKYKSRLYARQTIAKRIDATTALDFLEEHHLWSAVKSKYYYGLYTTKSPSSLVAVATFSSRRKVTRDGLPHRSHELIRFCTRRDGMVVGAISKLIKAFITDQQPDDIVTVVDRDWGPGDGWHQLGFQTVHVMPPLPMAISGKDGMRRHLVGAGIQSNNNTGSNTSTRSTGRLGLDDVLLEELHSQNTYEGAIHCLAQHQYYPVYDAGVERLLLIVSNQQEQSHQSAMKLWQNSVPTYASTYYSSNTGIQSLLDNAKMNAGEDGTNSLRPQI